jgi:hypothetical protein
MERGCHVLSVVSLYRFVAVLLSLGFSAVLFSVGCG